MTAPRIEHVVVLMMENRSFDHMLGHLNLDGADLVSSPRINTVIHEGGVRTECPTYPYPDEGDRAPWDNEAELPAHSDVRCDPGHKHAQIAVQMRENTGDVTVKGSTMMGFAQAHYEKTKTKILNSHPSTSDQDLVNEAKRIMGWHPGHHNPVLSTLAREYLVCTQWFCSVPGETWPNRMFAHQGHSSQHVGNRYMAYARAESVFDILNRAEGVEWAVYAGDVPQAAVHVGFKDALRLRMVLWSEFADDIRDGTLPNYCFLEPRHFLGVNSQHPTHGVGLGDELIREVYEALASDPEIWSKTLFIITWDEHGGFYDHHEPRAAEPPFADKPAIDARRSDDSEMRYNFDTTGVRVPALVISPWTRGAGVTDVEFDHTTIIKSTLDALGITDRRIGKLGKRVAKANSVVPLLTGDPQGPAPLPEPERNSLRRSAIARADSDLQLAEGELDSLQQSLLVLKERLDEAWHKERRFVGPHPPETEPERVSRLVREFQADHIAPRGSRPAVVRREQRSTNEK